jgi:hypothetical protein
LDLKEVVKMALNEFSEDPHLLKKWVKGGYLIFVKKKKSLQVEQED